MRVSQVVLVVKNMPASSGDITDLGLISGSGRSPGGRGNLLQYSCLENPQGQRSLVGYIHRVRKSWTWWKRLNTQEGNVKWLKWTLLRCPLEESGDRGWGLNLECWTWSVASGGLRQLIERSQTLSGFEGKGREWGLSCRTQEESA